MTWAIVPAGGQSTRMGRPKLSLPLGTRTVLEQVVLALQQGGCAGVMVVVGPHVPELVALAEGAGASTHLLAQPTLDMRATVEAGLTWLEQHHPPEPTHSWLLVPADHPTLSPDVVRAVLSSEGSIVIPTFQGRRGHPTRISWQHVPGIRALPRGVGLNVYLRGHLSQTQELPLTDESILFDLDTPTEYEKLCQEWGQSR